jgi:hypothetical protein
MFLDELRHFLSCVRGETHPVVDLREAARSLRISLCAEESLKKGTAVVCDEDMSGKADSSPRGLFLFPSCEENTRQTLT